MNPKVQKAVMEVLATERDLRAAVEKFQSALWRGQSFGVDQAHNAAMSALQAHLDAHAASIALARKDAGIQ